MYEFIKKAKAFVFDLDGTLYLEDTLIGDVKNTLNLLRKNGKKIVYLTNNSSKTDDEYLQKLKKIGILEKDDLFYSSLDAAVDYIKSNLSGARIYPVCTKKVKEYLISCELCVSDSGDTVLLTYDRELDYQKIVKANELLVLGAKYVATHPDLVCPAKGVSLPDLGSFIEMFYKSSGRRPDVITGKPYSEMANGIMKKLNVLPSETVMVGDRLNTDIAFGINSGFNTVLVYSGETTEKIYKESKINVDLAIKDVNELIKYL